MNRDNDNRLLPYKDPVLRRAQIVSIIAVYFFGRGWLLGICGIPACVILQVAWCRRMSKHAFLAAGILALLDALIYLMAGLFLVMCAVLGDGDDDDENQTKNDDNYYDPSVLFGFAVSLCFLGSFLWATVTVYCFVFVCQRMERPPHNHQQESQAEDTATLTDPLLPSGAATDAAP